MDFYNTIKKLEHMHEEYKLWRKVLEEWISLKKDYNEKYYVARKDQLEQELK